MYTYFSRLNATFTIAGLLMMAPFMAMARPPALTTSPHGDSIVKNRMSSRAADDEHRTSESDGSESANK
ncbi:hypothetical protein [Paraburkholderia hiiakae]|uniref:hypothetical protein n=1 Tax=Paraburkholderia hiiakae TaxID=1081782 RepID=UPI001919F4E4|nr:hypothetical protein [Paraburkholderia hiiakae]